MIIKILQSGDEAALEAFLMPRIESSMFLLGNMQKSGLLDGDKAYQGAYAAAYENGSIVAVVAHYWNQNLILQAPCHMEALLTAVIKASGRDVMGLLGPHGQVETAKTALGMKRDDYKMDGRDMLYGLSLDTLVEPEMLATGAVNGRYAIPSDTDLLTRWRVAYYIEISGETDSPELWQRCRTTVERTIKERNIWILEDNGRPVATTAFNATAKEAVQVGGVWTPVEFRRRGYARAIVAKSLQDACAEGVPKAILFTSEWNVAAQIAYEALGFEHIGDYAITLLRE